MHLSALTLPNLRTQNADPIPHKLTICELIVGYRFVRAVNPMNSAPVAKPVCNGVNTALYQYQEISEWSAFREAPDNAQGVAANLPADSDRVGIVSWITESNTPQEEGHAPGQMLGFVMDTVFDEDEWNNCFRLINPKRGTARSHLGSVHGQGMSNATIGLGRSDCSGQCLAVRRVPRARDDPLRALYPVQMQIQRFGRHANHVHAQENQEKEGDETRATIPGDFLVYPDKQRGVAVPWSGSFVRTGTYEAPTSTQEYGDEILLQAASKTRQVLLEDSPWAPDATQRLPHPSDLCDSLLTTIHEALRKLAQLKDQDYKKIFEGHAVIYFFWDLRDEIQKCPNTGAILVKGEPVHHKLANTYLPCHGPTRDYLKEVGFPVPDPCRLQMKMGSKTVHFENHWLLRKINPREAELTTVKWSKGEGRAQRVHVGKGYTIESYTVKANDLVDKSSLKRPVVLLHTASGLAIGEPTDFARNGLGTTGQQLKACVKEAYDLHSEAMGKHSFENWLTQREDSKFQRGLRGMVPADHQWTEQEVQEICEGLNQLHDIQKQISVAAKEANDAKKKEMNDKAREDAAAAMKLWDEANPKASKTQRNEKEYESCCRAGAFYLTSALSQISYMLTGHNIVHVVTVHNDDLAVNKQKSGIMGDTPTLLSICADLPRLNKEIMMHRIKQLVNWRADDLAKAKAERERKAEEEQARKEKAALERKAGAQKLAKDKETAERDARNKRMKEIGVFPRWDGGGKTVTFISLNRHNKDETCGTYDMETAQQELRAGTLLMNAGRGQGQYFVFKGADPTKGLLFKSKGSYTEIIKNPNQDPLNKQPSGGGGSGGGSSSGSSSSHTSTSGPNRSTSTSSSGGSSSSGGGGSSTAARRAALVVDPRGARAAAAASAALARQTATLTAAAAASAPASLAPLEDYTMRFDDGAQFVFSIPSDSSSPFVKQLCGNALYPMLVPFVSAMRAMPRIMGCLSNDGGLDMVYARGSKTRLRIVPVLHDPMSRRKVEARPTEVGAAADGQGRLIVFYMDVMHLCSGMPVDLTKEMTATFLSGKLAHATAKVYAKALRSVKYDTLHEAILGLMHTPSWQTVTDLQNIKVTTTAMRLGIATGKRRAPDTPAELQPPAQRSRDDNNNGGEDVKQEFQMDEID